MLRIKMLEYILNDTSGRQQKQVLAERNKNDKNIFAGHASGNKKETLVK